MNSTMQLLLSLLVLVGCAKIGGIISGALGQPTVLGKLLAGVCLGPSLLNVMHWSVFKSVPLHETLHSLSELGVIFLMFIAGLRTEADELKAAGRAATWTALLGVALPFAGGIAAARLWGFSTAAAIFVGLLLTATSVSISAQTLVELGKLKTRVGTTLLGAAVLDDVLGLLLLSVVLATADGSGGWLTVLFTVVRLVGFLSVVWFLGRRYLPRLIHHSAKLPIDEPVLAFAILVMLALAFGAEEIGSLAAITGAFMAGVLLSHTDVRDEVDRSVSGFTTALLVPLFLVSIGINTDLGALQGGMVGLTLVLCAVAVVTKVIGGGLGERVGGLPAREALQVGAGMVSRGEVGLIIATIGMQKGIIGADVFSMTVAVVLCTTLVTPMLLKWSFRTATSAQPTVLRDHEVAHQPQLTEA